MRLSNNVIFLGVYTLLLCVGIVVLVGVCIYSDNMPPPNAMRQFSKGMRVKIAPSNITGTVTSVSGNTLKVVYVDDYNIVRSATVPFKHVTKISSTN